MKNWYLIEKFLHLFFVIAIIITYLLATCIFVL